MKQQSLTLTELCAALHVTRRAVQGYEAHHLVHPTGRSPRGYLLYNADAQARIRRIKEYQDFGFTLKEIEALLPASAPALKRALECQREKLLTRRRQTEDALRRLDERINTLR